MRAMVIGGFVETEVRFDASFIVLVAE